MSSDSLTYYWVCQRCFGDGVYEPPGQESIPCPYCPNSSGATEMGRQILPDGVFYAFRVLEATDISEYNSLSVADKDLYKTVIAPGMVNLADGSVARTALLNLFGPGTNTRANLLALIT